MSKKSHHFLKLWPWPLTYDLEKLIRSGHYHYQCVYQIWEQSIPWFLSYHVNTAAGGGRQAVGGGRLRRKTITSPNPSDTGDIISENEYINLHFVIYTNNHLKSRPLNCYTSAQHRQINLLKQRQSGWHHADDTFKHIYIKRPLPPNMLNYFEDYKYIFTFWIISSAWPKKMKLTLEQQYISMA